MKYTRSLAGVGVALALALAGCGNGAGDDSTVEGTLAISPATAQLEVVNGVAAVQAFTVALVAPDGSTTDVTGQVAWAIDDPAFGSFSGASFTATGARAGKVFAHATLDTLVGDAQIEVNVRGFRIGDGVPANAPDLFAQGTEDPAMGPQVVYPPDQIIVPANLGDLEEHWTDGFGHDLFEMRLTGEHVDMRVYVRAGATGWAAFTSSEWYAAAHSARDLTLGLRALTEAAPASIGVAPNRILHTTNEDLMGGLYYWASAAASGAYGIFRHDFGAPGVPAEEFFTTTQAGRCVACHVLSRDGTRMAVGYDGGNRSSTIVDVASRTPMIAPETMFWNFATYTPDGTRLITSHDGTLTIRDGTSGNPLGTVPAGGYATHPDFAADGTKMVYVAVGVPNQDWHFTGGTIAIIPYDAATGAFGSPRTLINDGGNNYYPSFSPDGEWILFNRSSEDAYDDPSAELWVVKADGSQAPRKLDLANIGPGLTNSWARWAPFRNSYGPVGQSENLYWLTFSSKRAFGVRLAAGQPQIWMAPFFPGRVATGGDPTAPAFRLPFQSIMSSNHIAQWTETVVPIGKLRP